MIEYYNPFGARVWNIIRLGKPDDYGLYCSGRRNRFGTTLAARGTRAEIETLVARACLV